MKIPMLLIGVVLLIGGGFFAFRYYNEQQRMNTVTSYDSCVDAGYPVLESYPPRCTVPDGRSFIENIGTELEYIDEIQVDSPRPNQRITSAFPVRGKARGKWYFEGSFSGELYDANGRVLGTVILSAGDTWMTSEFVPFTGQLLFSTPQTDTGTLKLRSDNPSGLPENEKELVIPVTF